MPRIPGHFLRQRHHAPKLAIRAADGELGVVRVRDLHPRPPQPGGDQTLRVQRAPADEGQFRQRFSDAEIRLRGFRPQNGNAVVNAPEAPPPEDQREVFRNLGVEIEPVDHSERVRF